MPLICSASQWIGFYMTGTSVIKELKVYINKSIYALKERFGYCRYRRCHQKVGKKFSRWNIQGLARVLFNFYRLKKYFLKTDVLCLLFNLSHVVHWDRCGTFESAKSLFKSAQSINFQLFVSSQSSSWRLETRRVAKVSCAFSSIFQNRCSREHLWASLLQHFEVLQRQSII